LSRHKSPINVLKYQQHKYNPHEPLFLSVKQYEELCKTTYDGSVPFTFTCVVDNKDHTTSEGVEERKDDITVTEIQNESEETPYAPKKKKSKK
jgi:hypothetical protein